MLDGEEFGGVMNGAVAVVIVAHGAVEHVVAQNAVEGFALRRVRARRACDNVHALRGRHATGSHQFAVNLHHAGIAALDGAKLGVITNVRYFDSAAVDEVNQALSSLDCLCPAIDRGCHLIPTLRE